MTHETKGKIFKFKTRANKLRFKRPNGSTNSVCKMATMQQKAFCVLEYARVLGRYGATCISKTVRNRTAKLPEHSSMVSTIPGHWFR